MNVSHTNPVLVICGYGPGVSHAVAERWAKAGYQLALIARNKERLDKAVSEFAAKNITAHAYVANLADPEAVTKTIAQIQTQQGPVSILHWNAFAYGAGNLLDATTDELQALLDITVHGVLAAARAAHDGLVSQKGAILVTGGGFAFFEDQVDKLVARIETMGGAVAKAALHKVVGVLHHKLAGEGVYVGEVVINSTVKSTPFDDGTASLLPETVADLFWDLNTTRAKVFVTAG